jgi:hypothetical protein
MEIFENQHEGAIGSSRFDKLEYGPEGLGPQSPGV